MLNKFWWGNEHESKGVKWMRREKVCVKKEAGGRGFCDLHLFNISLLAKMGWRLTTDNDSLVCKILRAHYFPHGDFLSAKLGEHPSYTWASIHASQDLLRRGVR